MFSNNSNWLDLLAECWQIKHCHFSCCYRLLLTCWCKIMTFHMYICMGSFYCLLSNLFISKKSPLHLLQLVGVKSLLSQFNGNWMTLLNVINCQRHSVWLICLCFILVGIIVRIYKALWIKLYTNKLCVCGKYVSYGC